MKNKLSALLFCLFLQTALVGQEIYFANSFLDPIEIGTINIGINCNQNSLYPLDVNNTPRGLGIAPDQSFFALIRDQLTGDNLLVDIDAAFTTGTIVTTFNNFGTIRKLAFSPAGDLYFANVDELIRYDFPSDQTTNLGLIGFESQVESLILGLTFRNGQLYAATQDVNAIQKIIKVNLSNPLDSRLVATLDNSNFNQIGAMTTINNSCGELMTYVAISEFGGHRLYEIDVQNGGLTFVCDTGLPNFKAATTTSETFVFPCPPELDLDADDSSIGGLNFVADASCIVDSICFLGNTDIQITSTYIVDSLQIFFPNPPPDAGEEVLLCKDNAPLACENNGNGITLFNSAQLDDFALDQLLKASVFYRNNAGNPSLGNRTIAVVAFDSTLVSDTAFVTLPIALPAPETSFATACPGETYTWNGLTFSSDTLICLTTSNLGLCDSVSCLDLTFLLPQKEVTDVFCEGDTYSFLGTELSEAGQYSDTLEIVGDCDTLIVLTLEQVPALPLTILGDTTFCEESATELSTFELYESYLWSTGATTPSISLNTAGTYAVTITNSQGCTAESQVELSIENPLLATILASDVSCSDFSNGSISITEVSGGDAPYLFALNGGGFSTDDTFTDLNVGTYSLSIEDAEGCQLVQNITIEEGSSLFLSTNSLFELNLGDSTVVNFQTNAAEIQNLEVNPSENFRLLDSTQLLFFPQQNTDFTLTLTDATGCSVRSNFTFLVRQIIPIYAPNVFSPNNDGVNDFFQIFTTSAIQTISAFRIFNRWGGLMYDNTEKLFWDGTWNNEPAEMGVYVFFVEFETVDGRQEVLEGSLTLIR